MAEERVRLGLIGLGAWGGSLTAAAARSGEAEVISGYSRSEASRKAFEKKFGCRTAPRLEDLLEDREIEGVLIATPHSTHEDIIEQAASAGKHLFVEKPLTLTVAGAQKAMQAAAEAGVILQVGFKRRRSGANRTLRAMLDDGELGELQQLEGMISGSAGLNPPAGWRNDRAECPVGGMTTMGVHTIDTFHYLAGPVKRVFAFSKKTLGRGNLDDISVIGLEFESGPLGYLSTSWAIPKIITVAAYGTDGAAWSEEDGARLFFQKSGEDARHECPAETGDPVADQLAEFARCIRGEAEPETGANEGLEVTAVLQAIGVSVDSGKAVNVSEIKD